MAQPLSVFISYSRIDAEVAHRITEVLEHGRHRAWIDNQLVPGQRWKEKIEQAIDNCDAFLILLSPTSVTSEHCQWEYALAIEKQKPIFPVLIKPVENSYPNELADLENIQYVDMSEGITAANTASLIGGVFSARPVTQTKIPIQSREPSKPPVEYTQDTVPNSTLSDDLNLFPSDVDGTEPLTRLPLPNQNPLPGGITASLSVIKSLSLGTLKRAIHTTNYTVGRAPTMSLAIPEKRISKHHLTIYWANSRFFVVDYSLNGTWLNGELIENNRPLRLDDDFDHRLDLARNNTVLNFKYTLINNE